MKKYEQFKFLKTLFCVIFYKTYRESKCYNIDMHILFLDSV